VILTGHEVIAAMLVKMEKTEAEEAAKKARLVDRVSACERKAAMKAHKARAGPKRKRQEAYADSGTETDEEDMSPAAKAATQNDNLG